MQPDAQIRVGITGHLDLTADTAERVSHALRHHLSSLCDPEDLLGVSCLARGADTLFAQELLSLGGRLKVIIPSADYVKSQVRVHDVPNFLSLIQKASSVITMPAPSAGEAAYAAANGRMLDSINHLIAVWDGRPNGGAGGTVAVVRDARARSIPVTVIWPEGSGRESSPPTPSPDVTPTR